MVQCLTNFSLEKLNMLCNSLTCSLSQHQLERRERAQQLSFIFPNILSCGVVDQT